MSYDDPVSADEVVRSIAAGAREGCLRPTLPSQWMIGFDVNGLSWMHNIMLGTWPETYMDEQTGMLRGLLQEEDR